MKPKQPKFTAERLNALIDKYFTHIKGEYESDDLPVKSTKATTAAAKKKVWLREPEPATITGLAFFLGFNSRQAFDDYEANGRLAHILKRGRLGIEVEYEKKLHQQPASGAIFALKNMGWNEKADSKLPADDFQKSLEIKIIETGPAPASSEKEVVL
jgi:hypothetical protein